VGSALALPFPGAAFDGAYMIHVGMNNADKATLFREARRVVRQGGTLAVYDVMRASPGGLPYPMPWSATAETSFVETPAVYRRLIEAAGFAIVQERDRSAFVRDILQQMREDNDKHGPPLVGMERVASPDRARRSANVQAALKQGLIAPTEIIARAV
jgi:ubiquinone/menaquinone biosynthesis C-methylase UbiE